MMVRPTRYRCIDIDQMAKITFNDISIENFGPFRERQTINLSVSTVKPVVLIKALNGSGKTTLLNALQIGLYGYKGTSMARRSDYDQFITGLLRNDAIDNAAVEINLIIESGGVSKSISLRREWLRRGTALVENLSVSSCEADKLELTESWDELINGILPAELVQLFLFDGEKIEALANPERLPDLLRRATEVFLGLGGIDALENDLKAVERRANQRDKSGSVDLNETRAEAEKYERQRDEYLQRVTMLSQQQAELCNTLDRAKIALERFTVEAKRSGLTAYEDAARLRANAEAATTLGKDARSALVDAIGNPVLPLVWLGAFWERYKVQWKYDQQARHANLLVAEFRKRDRRLLKTVALSEQALAGLEKVLADDLSQFSAKYHLKPVLLEGGDPVELQLNLNKAVGLVRSRTTAFAKAVTALEKAEQTVGQIPAEEQLVSVFSSLQDHSKAVSSAEIQLQDVADKLADARSNIGYIELRLNAVKQRLRTDFKTEALEQHGLEAAARTRKVLSLFRERLFANKAQWLSEMITLEFRELLHKKNMISRVEVNPESYEVSIRSSSGAILPMARLSAGERQILAIAVLSALIRERKGRFPVVVDTPLARLDQKHREALINNFFAKVSHQVLVLSTDEEVHGHAYNTLLPFVSVEHRLDYDESQNCTVVVNEEELK